MAKNKRPAYYAAPLKSRLDIIDFLVGHDDYQRFRDPSSPLAWNVKCYDADFSGEHLMEVYRKSGEYDNRPGGDRWLDFPEWRKPALEKLKEIEDDLWAWAVEDARMHTEDDTNRSLWKGDLLDVKYTFSGRSGGWLIITRFEGTKLEGMSDNEFREYLEELEYKTLRNLYELVVQNDHDFRKEAVKEALEFAAAFTWIENCCVDIPRPDKTQAELPLEV